MATNGELDWRTDKLAVFWTDEKRLAKAVLSICRFRCLQDFGDDLKGEPKGADSLAVQEAKDFLASIPHTQELYTHKMRTAELNAHEELTIAAEDLSDWDAVKA
jgi:ATP adenylyltransferase/5',5'''-P-1,P-4-tetraphosphate phosphorylase II